MIGVQKEAFLEGFNGNYEGVFVDIQRPNYPEPEVVYDGKANFDLKRNYYAKAYNENLEMKRNKNIKIVKYVFE